MKKILVHTTEHRVYVPLLQELSKYYTIIAGNLHESIFDLYHKYKPDFVILPIYEYTNEFHQFVDSMKDKTDIILFMGEVVHAELLEYCSSNKIKIIRQSDDCTDPLVLSYKYLYDPTIFKNMDMIRKNKILTILSNNNEYNHKILDSILYPKTNHPLILINNPEFDHPQNVGVATTSDISILMNKYDYLLDLSELFYIESQACEINNIRIDDNLEKNISDRICNDKLSDIEKYSIQNFIQNKLLSFIGE